MPELVYVIGEPGSGKSTALASLTAPHLALPCRKPFAHIVYAGDGWEVVELGAHRPGFAGTDALSMSVQPAVLAWLADTNHTLVIAEGDRLANSKFFRAVLDVGWNLTVIHLTVSPVVATLRREDRARALGVEPQGPTWVQGRRTKVANLAAAWPCVTIDANQPAADVAAALAAVEAPPIRLLASNP